MGFWHAEASFATSVTETGAAMFAAPVFIVSVAKCMDVRLPANLTMLGPPQTVTGSQVAVLLAQSNAPGKPKDLFYFVGANGPQSARVIEIRLTSAS